MKHLFIPIIMLFFLGCSEEELNEASLSSKKLLKSIVRSDGFVTHKYTYNNADLLESFTLNNEFRDYKQVKTYAYFNDTIIENEKAYLNGDLVNTKYLKHYPLSNNQSRTDYLFSGGELSHYSISYYGSCGVERIETFWNDNKLRETRKLNYNNDCSRFKMEELTGSINYIQEYITDIKNRGGNKNLGIFHQSTFKKNFGNIIFYNYYTETANGRNDVQKNKYTYEYDDLDNPIKLTKEYLHLNCPDYTYTYYYQK